METIDSEEKPVENKENIDIEKNPARNMESIDTEENPVSFMENIDIGMNPVFNMENIDLEENSVSNMESIDIEDNRDSEGISEMISFLSHQKENECPFFLVWNLVSNRQWSRSSSRDISTVSTRYEIRKILSDI
ncbi:hypothetical protein AVEN_93046-1 [Araneus ventricosus]|uniref:Uncharacterized protein n=1 Tax=Araneus ventricosus TaxID=182803 RepID=A0A4Y2VPK3_ARAVE|nr:hypothetical protein AVEN_93046-1 [Araneus ventricosus]